MLRHINTVYEELDQDNRARTSLVSWAAAREEYHHHQNLQLEASGILAGAFQHRRQS